MLDHVTVKKFNARTLLFDSMSSFCKSISRDCAKAMSQCSSVSDLMTPLREHYCYNDNIDQLLSTSTFESLMEDSKIPMSTSKSIRSISIPVYRNPVGNVPMDVPMDAYCYQQKQTLQSNLLAGILFLTIQLAAVEEDL